MAMKGAIPRLHKGHHFSKAHILVSIDCWQGILTQEVQLSNLTCDGNRVRMPFHFGAHKAHHFSKAHISLQTAGTTSIHSHSAACYSCTSKEVGC